MARPKKSDDQKRDMIMRVRLTAHEKKKITELAKASGHTPSDLVRMKTIASNPTQRQLLPERELLIRYLAHLGKIGSNLNQIAREANRRAKTGEKMNFGSELITSAIQSVETLSMYLLKILKDDYSRKNTG